MYLGQLGQGSTGERFRIISSRKGGRVSCPSGTTQESSGRLGTGQNYVWCHRPAQFAPPPVTTTTISPQIVTRVPTAVTTAVSPMISPTLAQQQASPGAGVQAAPVAAPGPVTGPTGITGEDLERILAAQRAATAAEEEARERQRQTELETMRREIAERERATQEIYLAEQKAAADRAEMERFAREQAEAEAAAAAAAIPAPATYTPTGGGVLPTIPAPFVPPSVTGEAPIRTEARDVTITQAQPGEVPWALILLAGGGVLALAMLGGKGKRKRAKK